jgi:hypothetical protein
MIVEFNQITVTTSADVPVAYTATFQNVTTNPGGGVPNGGQAGQVDIPFEFSTVAIAEVET